MFIHAKDECIDLEDDEWHPQLHVGFIVEEGIDTGALSREFFSILFKQFADSSSLVRRSENRITFMRVDIVQLKMARSGLLDH